MADDEVGYTAKKKVVHFGSLEETERARLAAEEAGIEMETEDGSAEADDDEKQKTESKGHVYTSSGNSLINILIKAHSSFSSLLSEYMPIEESVPEDKQATLDELERRKRARMMAITTDDSEVKRYLRHLGEPITLFGEGPADRRIRLKELLSYYGPEAIEKKKEEEREVSKQEKEQAETTWYHEGPQDLMTARLFMAKYSLPRAKQRLANARAELEAPEATRTAKR